MVDEREVIEAIEQFNTIEGVEQTFDIGVVGKVYLYSCDEHGDVVVAAVHDPQAESNKFCPECYEHLSRERIRKS